MLATDRPDLVRGVSLVAANVGHAPSPPVVREAIKASANPALPDAERLKALQFAFFAPATMRAAGSRAGIRTCWRRSASPATAPRARRTTPPARAPILYLQPDHDPLAHVEDAHEFKRALGDRVTVTVIRNCQPRRHRGAARGDQRR